MQDAKIENIQIDNYADLDSPLHIDWNFVDIYFKAIQLPEGNALVLPHDMQRENHICSSTSFRYLVSLDKAITGASVKEASTMDFLKLNLR